jgi:hypothetical protein
MYICIHIYIYLPSLCSLSLPASLLVKNLYFGSISVLIFSLQDNTKKVKKRSLMLIRRVFLVNSPENSCDTVLENLTSFRRYSHLRMRALKLLQPFTRIKGEMTICCYRPVSIQLNGRFVN